MATLKNHPGFWLRDDAAAAFNEAEADHGRFQVNSAGRTVAEQQALINRWDRGGAANRPPFLFNPARPARTSTHVKNGGAAVDVGDWRRFAKVCERYGFVQTHPKSDPVHFEFRGRAGGVGQTQRRAAAYVNRRVSPDTKTAPKKDGLKAGVVGNFTGWRRGEKVAGNDVWFRGVSGDWFWSGGFTSTSTAGLADLNPKPKPPAKPGRPVLRRGSKGAAVELLQRTLKAHYPLYAGKLKVDGVFGPAVEKVVREFQKRAGLVVDGIVGVKTWARLGL